MFRKLSAAAGLSIAFLNSACGCGGDEGKDAAPLTSTDPDIVFKLFTAGFLNPGYLEEYLSTGTTANAGAALAAGRSEFEAIAINP